MIDVVDAIQPVRQTRGRPRKRPAKLHADKGYDFGRCRRDLRARGITPRLARRGIDSSKHLGKHRWVVERTFAWINQFDPQPADVRDRDGAVPVLRRSRRSYPFITKAFADAG